MTIGERLKLERLRLGLTQPQLAAIGLTTKKSQIDYEQGNSYPKASYLAAVSQFGVDVNYIVTGERGTTTPLTKALIGAFFRADELTQQMIIKLLGIDLANINSEVETNNEGGQGNITGNNNVGSGSFTGSNNTNNSNNSSTIIGHIKKTSSVITGGENVFNINMSKKND